MKTSSAKAKGRRAAAGLSEALLLSFPELGQDDIIVPPSSCTGEDLRLSPAARRVLPFSFEVKNQERLRQFSATGWQEFTPIKIFENIAKQNMEIFKQVFRRIWQKIGRNF